ncbi:MAG: hypothetical protein HFG62_19060 [Lachnospiraceae bacterium]|jgi:hypothetical protein|nr:hypothetical protein [Lachnospiraceae bacterium]
MIRTDRRTSSQLAYITERFRLHREKARSEDPFVAGVAAAMCEIELWEMWALTQVLGRPRIQNEYRTPGGKS